MIRFRVMEKNNIQDRAFFDLMELESYKTTIQDIEKYTEEEIKSKFEKFLKADPLDINKPEHHIIIAEDENKKRVGLIWLARREPFWIFTEELVWIYNIHILSNYRGKGIASNLLKKAEQWASEQKLKMLALHVLNNNKAARKLYDKLGYKLTETHNESCFYQKDI